MSGWNKPSAANQPAVKKGGVKSPSLIKGAIVGAVAVVIGIVCIFAFSGKSKKPVKDTGTKPAKINDVTPAVAKQEEKVVKSAEGARPLHYWELPTTNGLTETQIRKWKFMHEPAPSYTNRVMASRPRPKYAIFKTRPENEIAALISAKPGASMVGERRYTDKFKEEFLKSCEVPIVVSEDDDEYTANLKREMNQVKIELRQRMADGEDLGQILADTRKEIQRLAQVKKEVEAEMRKMIKETAVTEEDVDTCIDAANKLLESKGVAPVRMNPLLRTALKRSIQENQSVK